MGERPIPFNYVESRWEEIELKPSDWLSKKGNYCVGGAQVRKPERL